MNAESQPKRRYLLWVWGVATFVCVTGLGLAVAQQTNGGATPEASSSGEPTDENEVEEARQQKSLAALGKSASRVWPLLFALRSQMPAVNVFDVCRSETN